METPLDYASSILGPAATDGDIPTGADAARVAGALFEWRDPQGPTRYPERRSITAATNLGSHRQREKSNQDRAEYSAEDHDPASGEGQAGLVQPPSWNGRMWL